MNYDDARKSVKNGDVIFFKASTFKQRIITLFTGGQYSHVGIAFWIRPIAGSEVERLMLLESTNGGRRIIDLRSYAYRGMSVCQTPVNWEKVADDFLSGTGAIHYSYLDFLRIGAKKLFGLHHVEDDKKGEVCSEMVAKAILASGIVLSDEMPDPDTLALVLETQVFTEWFDIEPLTK